MVDSLSEFDRFGWDFGVAGIIWYTLMYQSLRIQLGIVAVGVAGSRSIVLLATDIDLRL